MIWAWDIETQDWTTFVLGYAISERGDVCSMDSAEEVRSWLSMLSIDDTVIVHNGGAFDFLYLLSITRDLPWTARLAGSSISEMSYRKGPRFVDSYLLVRQGLARWSGSKDSLADLCNCDKHCGGYCRIRVDMEPAIRAKVRDYCAQDCRALLAAYKRTVTWLADNGFEIFDRHGRARVTIGSIAWATAKRMAAIEVGRMGRGLALQIQKRRRRAYYGGRVEVYRADSPTVHPYDVHGMYAWALTQPVPVGREMLLRGSEARRAYDRSDPAAAQYLATVDVPRGAWLAPLPHRIGGGKRLLWSTGIVRAWWTGIDLSRAEDQGCTIVDLDAAAVWPSTDALYAPYVEHCYLLRERARADGDASMEALMKLAANSLSGKLAQRSEIATVRLNVDDPKTGWSKLGGGAWLVPGERSSACAHPHQAAVVTARGRAVQGDALLGHPDLALYGDTDSAYLSEPGQIEIGDRIGAWGYEGPAKDWRALAPKVYEYRRAHKWHVRAKGIPRPDHERFCALAEGDSVSWVAGVRSVRVAGAAMVAQSGSRSVQQKIGWCGQRTVGADGRTWPVARNADGSYETAGGYPLVELASGIKREAIE